MIWFNPVRRMFDSSYRDRPPWDLGRPRQQFVELVRQGEITGPVLDLGCGTGENALFFAEQGLEVLGIDFAPRAIRLAEQKAKERGVRVQFRVQDALVLEGLGRTFMTATDSGFFHTLSDRDRPVFARSLAGVLVPGGRYFMISFSDREPPGYGPRRVSEREIRECFRDGWSVQYILPTVIESAVKDPGPRGWLSLITKT
jgi:ubiquinone/menaquinone biosynthesis C-methylase UbiE